ncbi:MAG: LLM class flavin-dependent oxidoreductase [Dehalococcoidia bacterium]|nr:LLM class flavin-dependent oxidoreductase [Dehalococcoidia bacterium]
MAGKLIGVGVMARDAAGVLANIEEAERLGIPAVWLTAGGIGQDPITIFAVAAQRTRTVLMGTSIVQMWPRHPVALAQQVRTLVDLAPGRFRLGVGPSHEAGMTGTYGVDFKQPLGHLREYLRILKALLQQGAVDFDGRFYTAHTRAVGPADVPVMASALRRGSFELCGAEADGAISWVCPGAYLRDVALPAMLAGAQQASRPVPPLITHAPVCVHDNRQEALAAAREQLGFYPRAPYYAQMFVDAGFPEAKQGAWSDAMVDAVVLSGDEARVTERLRQLFDWGTTEVLAHVITAGADREASRQRTLRLLAQAAKQVAQG